jgi:hypothetical protein
VSADLEGNRIAGGVKARGSGSYQQQRGEKVEFFHENLLKRPR